MANMDQTLNLLRRSDRSFQRTQRRIIRVRLATVFFVGLIYLVALAFSVIGLVRAWQSGEWFENFWMGFPPLPLIAINSVRALRFADDRAPLFAPVAALRQAIRAGDASLAPLANSAAPASSDAMGRENPTRFRGLRRPAQSSGAWLIVSAVVTLCVLAIVALPALSLENSLLAAIATIALVPLAAFLLVLGLRMNSRFTVRINGSGLRWRTAFGRRQFLAWSDVQALFLAHRAADFSDGHDTQYTMAGERAALAWRVRDSEADDPRRATSATLCRVITERTSLPLRDVSTEARRIGWDVGGISFYLKLTPDKAANAARRRIF